MFDTLFGSSWRTAALGYAQGLAIVILDVVQQDGLPHDAMGYLGMGIAVLVAVKGRLTKDANVTNAPKPVEAKPVPATIATGGTP